jgi:hypothetical protein
MSVIPRRVIFAWYGRDLPLMVRAAVRSAIEVLKPDETLLIHAGLEADTPGLESLRRRSGFVTERVGADWFAGLPAGGDMARLHDRVPSAAAKANILRLAALWKLGGLYLDTDTVAVRDLGELWDRNGICGLEPVALPPELYRSRDPLRWTGAGVKLAVREILARAPGGARAFRSIRGWYRSCVNNAVLGSCARNPLLGRAFELIAAMDERERLRKYRLGPHLLQALTENVSSEDMTVLPESYFYPLGPVISAQWFRRNSARDLAGMLPAETRIVHWYRSVARRMGRNFGDGADAAISTGTSAFAALIRPYLEDDERGA